MTPIRPPSTTNPAPAARLDPATRPTSISPTSPTRPASPASPVTRPTDAARPVTDLRAMLSRINASMTQTQRADASAQSADAALEQVGGLIDELRTLAATAARRGADDAAPIQQSRERIDQILEQIRSASETASRGPISSPATQQQISGVQPGVNRPSAQLSWLTPGQSQQVVVDVLASAQQGAFYLSFAGQQIDLTDNTSRFVIEIGGRNGAQEISFASGTSIQQIAHIINSYSQETGVRALASANTAGSFGVALRSIGLGDHEFTSVRVIHSGGINTANVHVGVYQMQESNANAAIVSTDPRDRMLFSSSNVVITDHGKDVRARIFGQEAFTHGGIVKVSHPAFRVGFELDEALAQRVDWFIAFTVTAPQPSTGGPVTAPPSMSQLASLDAQSLLDSATKRPGELAELLDHAAEGAGQWRKAIDDYRQNTLLPELRRLNDEIARAMLGGRSGPGQPVREELTPERAAALLRTRPGLGS